MVRRSLLVPFVLVLLMLASVGAINIYQTASWQCESDLSATQGETTATIQQSDDGMRVLKITAAGWDVPTGLDALLLVRIERQDSPKYFMTRWQNTTITDPYPIEQGDSITISQRIVPFDMAVGQQVIVTYRGEDRSVPEECDTLKEYDIGITTIKNGTAE